MSGDWLKRRMWPLLRSASTISWRSDQTTDSTLATQEHKPNASHGSSGLICLWFTSMRDSDNDGLFLCTYITREAGGCGFPANGCSHFDLTLLSHHIIQTLIMSIRVGHLHIHGSVWFRDKDFVNSWQLRHVQLHKCQQACGKMAASAVRFIVNTNLAKLTN